MPRDSPASFTVPRELLIKSSDYFKKCLNGNFAEASSGVIVMKDVAPEIFELYLQQAYSADDLLDRQDFIYYLTLSRLLSSATASRVYVCRTRLFARVGKE